MANTILERDASDLDGSDTTVSADVEITQDDAVTLLFVNDLDVSATATALLSHHDDDDMSDAYPANSQSVGSGDRGAETLNRDVWERVGVTLSFSGNPSGGSIKIMLLREAAE